MEQSFNHLADAVRLPESSRARIRTQIASHRKEQEASTVKQPKSICRGWPWRQSSSRRR